MVEYKCNFPKAGVDSSSPLSFLDKTPIRTGPLASGFFQHGFGFGDTSGEFKRVWRRGGEDGVVGGTRDIQRLPATPFSLLVLRKEYFDCPQRDSHAVHYIFKRGGVESVLLYSVV
jgi:hypothetical protein